MAQSDQEIEKIATTLHSVERKQEDLSRLVNQILIALRDLEQRNAASQNAISQQLSHVDRQVAAVSTRVEQIDQEVSPSS